jgi:hypothetical protein
MTCFKIKILNICYDPDKIITHKDGDKIDFI